MFHTLVSPPCCRTPLVGIAAFFATAGAWACLAGAPAAAWAAAPPNDLVANATVISSLPFSQTVDTTAATVDGTDAQVAAACGYPGQLSASVWYAFTPSSDQYVTVDFTGSSYEAVAGVVTGAPGSFQPVACEPVADEPTFVARTGQTYYMDMVGIGSFPGGTLHFSVTGQATPPFLEQSFASPSTGSASINGCCDYLGQTFTSGRTGLLTGVNVDVIQALTSAPLTVAIRSVSAGLPTSTVLGQTTLASSNSPITELITFPKPIHVTAGTRYAIVVNYPGVQPPGEQLALWSGAAGDLYPGGTFVSSADNGVTWSSDNTFDMHFQTYVEPLPTSTDQCKNGGWRNFPQFKDQGDCVSFVETSN